MLTRPEHLVPKRSDTVRRRGAAFPFLALVAVALGLALGLGSAWYALERDYPFGRVRVGAWTMSPRVGSREIDPYARAIVSRRGDLPLGVGEGLALRTVADDERRPIESRCTYRIGRIMPPARAWTLTAYDDSGRGSVGSERGSLTSAAIVRRSDGSFDITLSPEVMPDNWLQSPASAGVILILRLYDTPIASGTAAIDRNAIPRIERMGCPS